MDCKTLLASITGTADQELLVCNEWSCTCSLRIIVSPQKPDKMASLHTV